MKITAITRYKHATLYLLLRKLKWTQSELARRADVCPTHIGRIINMTHRPTKDVVDKIQAAFGAVGEYLDVLEAWPEEFHMPRNGFRNEQTADIDPEWLALQDCPDVKQLAAPVDVESVSCGLRDFVFTDQVAKLIGKLPAHHRVILKMRYLHNMEPSEIADRFKIPVSAVNGLVLSAKKKLQSSPRLQRIAHLAFREEAELDLDDEEVDAIERRGKYIQGAVPDFITESHFRHKGEDDVEFQRRVKIALDIESELEAAEKPVIEVQATELKTEPTPELK